MESRKRVDPPHCVNGCDFNRSIKNCNLCSKCFKENEETDIGKAAAAAVTAASVEEEPLKKQDRFSFSGDTNGTIFGANSNFGASSSSVKNFCFSSDYNNVASGSIFKFTTLPEISARNFTFGASTVTNKRCKCCKKRIGLLGFACKCGHLFCGNHRYPEEHKCSFDYKAFGRDLLRKQNPGLLGDKLHTRI